MKRCAECPWLVPLGCAAARCVQDGTVPNFPPVLAPALGPVQKTKEPEKGEKE